MSWRNAPENFFFRGTGLPTAVRKNQPLVPRSNLGAKVCSRTDPWFRGQTLLVPGHGGGGYTTLGVWLGFIINARKTKVHHWRSQPSTESIDFHEVTVLLLPAVAQYSGHVLVHKSLRLSVEQDILQTATTDLKSYEDLPLTAWERTELVSTTLLPRWYYKWLLALNDTTMNAIDTWPRMDS